MYLSELESVLRTAVVAYQVEHNGKPYLVDPDNVSFELLLPGTWDSRAEKRVERWTFVMGEEGDRSIARAEGDTLAAALDAFAALVRERANVVHALLDGGDTPDGDDRWRRITDDTAFAPPFGTVRVCGACGCLVAGGPTRCGRCAGGTT